MTPLGIGADRLAAGGWRWSWVEGGCVTSSVVRVVHVSLQLHDSLGGSTLAAASSWDEWRQAEARCW